MAPSRDSSAQPQERTQSDDAVDLAQAYRDLARGEQAATALENNLSNLESKLDALLAAFESSEAAAKPGKGPAEDDAAEDEQTREDETANSGNKATGAGAEDGQTSGGKGKDA